jgi:hypothetical protein
LREERSSIKMLNKRQVKVKKKLRLASEILKFFPKPLRMGEPLPTQWERPSNLRPKERQIVRNSY